MEAIIKSVFDLLFWDYDNSGDYYGNNPYNRRYNIFY